MPQKKRFEPNCRAWLEMRKKEQTKTRKSISAQRSEDLVTSWLRSFIASGYWTFTAWSFHWLLQELIYQGVYWAMNIPIPPRRQGKPVLHVGGWGQAPLLRPARLHSLLQPLYNSGLLTGLSSWMFCWSGWCSWELLGGSPPGQISCLELTKGCRAGWIWKARVANFIWKQVGTTTVITTVLCIVCASRLFRNQTALAKRVGKNIQTQFPWYHFYAPLISECRVYITIKVIFR